jgi:hypothetical protein
VIADEEEENGICYCCCVRCVNDDDEGSFRDSRFTSRLPVTVGTYPKRFCTGGDSCDSASSETAVNPRGQRLCLSR